MRFALIGNHPDGLAMARALVVTGPHELIAVCDADPPDFAPQARKETDLEEVLADPAVEWVIIAGSESKRGEQLRRAVQSERPTMCVHPCSERPDFAYEIALLAEETKQRVIALCPDGRHTVFQRLIELLKSRPPFQLLQWEFARSGELPTKGPSWDVLRQIGGDIVEVSGLTATEEITRDKPLLVAGRFAGGGLFQVTLRPDASKDEQHLVVHAANLTVEIDGPQADGRAVLRWREHNESWKNESLGPIDVWNDFAASALRGDGSWNDEVRALELQDALKRSVEKRRTSSLEFQEISEEVGSKGTLTLIGCGMIWIILLIFGVSIWVPWIRWAVVPLLLGYLVLLGMNWLAKKP